MKRSLLLACIALGACSITQENGELKAEAPPLLRHQAWLFKPDEERCTVSYGDVDVTRWVEKGKKKVIVSTRQRRTPGDEYKIIAGPHVYRMNGAHYTLAESAAIVRDFLKGGTAYTEWSEPAGRDNVGSSRRRTSNVLDLSGFAGPYEACDSKR